MLSLVCCFPEHVIANTGAGAFSQPLSIHLAFFNLGTRLTLEILIYKYHLAELSGLSAWDSGNYPPTESKCSCQQHTEIATWQERPQNIRSAGF